MKKKSKPDGQPSVFQEAWENMGRDFNRLLPEKWQQKQGKKKILLALAIIELLFLGGLGALIYRWWSS